MSLEKNLNLKGRIRTRVIGKPADIDLDDVVVTNSTKAEAISFVKALAKVDAKCVPIIEAKEDRTA
jgi:hypothetical protein